MHLHARVLLFLVVQDIGHDCLVVGDVDAEGDGDRLAAAVVRNIVALADTVARRAKHAGRPPRQAERRHPQNGYHDRENTQLTPWQTTLARTHARTHARKITL